MAPAVACPFSVRVSELACMLNLELAEHPVYDGVELQWFDDDEHGTGMLAFLSRRQGRIVDYYAEPGLRLDRGSYQLGGGTGQWLQTCFEVARLTVTEDGVDADVRFTDVDGRSIEVRVDDRDGRSRRRAGLLAPVGAGVDRPASLLLVWMPGFDLVRATERPPVVRIDGRDARIGRLPGSRVHRRHLVKYAAPVVTVEVNRAGLEHGVTPAPRHTVEVDGAGALANVLAEQAGHQAVLRLRPALPDLGQLPDGSERTGRWFVEVDGTRLTGGTWWVARTAAVVRIGLDVSERWRPRRLPWLMRLVTTLLPVFRRWPTTYRWRAELGLPPRGPIEGRWERTGDARGIAYRRATRS